MKRNSDLESEVRVLALPFRGYLILGEVTLSLQVSVSLPIK